MALTYRAASTPVIYLGHRYGIGEEIPAEPGDLDDLIEMGVVSAQEVPDAPPAEKPAHTRKAVKANG